MRWLLRVLAREIDLMLAACAEVNSDRALWGVERPAETTIAGRGGIAR